jgi:regulator of sigma E protease
VIGFLSDAWPWALTVLGFMVLIIIHELGHFFAAKATGMRVEQLSLFFGPKIVRIRRGETEYAIGTIPAGGYAKITGMNPAELEPPSEDRKSGGGVMTALEGAGEGIHKPLPPDVVARAYYNQPVWKRIVVVAAGPAMNVLLAFAILFAISFSVDKVDGRVGTIDSGTPAAQQLQSGDKILAVDGKGFPNATTEERLTHFSHLVASHKCAVKPPTDGCNATTPVQLKLRRDGQLKTISITPVYDSDLRRTRLGFSYGTRSVDQTPAQAVGSAASDIWRVTSGTIGVFTKIFQAEERKKIHGIVGISDVTRQSFEYGAVTALSLVALISLSLAIINLFPFLPLDGGHIFWSLVEKVRGKRVPFSVMERASAVGFLLVLILFTIGLTNDIHSLNNGGLNLR